MLHGSEINIQFRSHIGSYNLNYYGEGLVRFHDKHIEIEGNRLKENPGFLRACYGGCMGILFDCACCGIGNYVLVALSAFTLKPLVWMFGSEESTTPLYPTGSKPIQAKSRVVRFVANTPDIYMKLRFCFIADTDAQAQVLAAKLEELRPKDESEQEA